MGTQFLWIAAGRESHRGVLDELGVEAQHIYNRIVEAKARYNVEYKD